MSLNRARVAASADGAALVRGEPAAERRGPGDSAWVSSGEAEEPVGDSARDSSGGAEEPVGDSARDGNGGAESWSGLLSAGPQLPGVAEQLAGVAVKEPKSNPLPGPWLGGCQFGYPSSYLSGHGLSRFFWSNLILDMMGKGST